MKGLSVYIVLFFAFGLTAVFGQVTTVPINEVSSRLLKKGVLVDVRTAEEFSEGHLPKAVNIDVKKEEFIEDIQKLRKNKTVLLYCRSGKRSARAAQIMDSLGFKKVYNLDGGYLAWKEDN